MVGKLSFLYLFLSQQSSIRKTREGCGLRRPTDSAAKRTKVMKTVGAVINTIDILYLGADVILS